MRTNFLWHSCWKPDDYPDSRAGFHSTSISGLLVFVIVENQHTGTAGTRQSEFSAGAELFCLSELLRSEEDWWHPDRTTLRPNYKITVLGIFPNPAFTLEM